MRFRPWIFLIILFISRTSVHAQESAKAPAESGNIEVEALYDRLDTEDEQKKEDRQRKKETEKQTEKQREDRKDVTSISELVDLAPFTDIATISRKFLPKTKRFGITGLGGFGMNNAYFSQIALNLRLSYNLTEKYGIEGIYMKIDDNQRAITKNLLDKQNISTRSLVNPESFMGVAFQWSPLYGKMAWLNKTIVPFDLYFNAGIGTTSTVVKDGESTFHFGTGQIFGLSKSLGIRWDLTWNIYQATAKEKQDSGNEQTVKKQQSDLLLAFGVTFFFPEVDYR